MGDRGAVNHPSELRRALHKLVLGAGTRREDLLEALEGELQPLQACWSVNLHNGLHVAQQTVAVNLRAHIADLKVRPGRQELSLRNRRKQYEHAVGVCFNIDIYSELDGMNLTQRQAWLAKDARGLLKIDESTCKRDLKDALDQIEQLILDSDYAPVRAEDLQEPEQILIDRDEYMNHLRSYLDAGNQIICIWGEPGTGKTILAKRFAAQSDNPNPVLTIRMPPALEAPTAESLLFRQDLTEALIAEGLEPSNWSLEYSLSRFRGSLAGRVRAKAVIIDNVEREDLIWQLIPAQPKVPIIITMRSKPQSQSIVCEELHDFTEAQASEFISLHLPDQNRQEVADLASVLGYRPLALEHAVLFIKESPDVSMRSLTRSLTIDIADTLTTVTLPEQRERSIARLYELIVTSLLEHEPSRVTLDAFLAVGGYGTSMYRELLYAFMQSEQGGSHDRLYLRAGLRALAKRGLLREQQAPRPDPFKTDDASRSPMAELSMHALTYHILRDLRGQAPLEIEARYVEFLQTADHLPSGDERVDVGWTQAWTIRECMKAAQDGLPDGWLSFRVVDEQTWVVVQESQESESSGEPCTVRYVVRTEGIYKFNYQTGQWSQLNAEEVHELYLAALVYYERSGSEFIGYGLTLPDGPQALGGRLDREITPQDDYGHAPIDPVPVRYCINHGIGLWSLCGKHFIPTSFRSDVSCPDCRRMLGSAERLAEIEVTLRRNFFGQLGFKHPLVSAYLLLIRAKLRRDLERFEEARRDVESSYSFLLLDSKDSPYEHLAVGTGIMEVASSIPGASRDWVIRVSEHLTESMGSTDPAITLLLYSRSQSLSKIGLNAEALADLDRIAELIDSGIIDRENLDVELWRVLYEKEEAERGLGRINEANSTMRRVISELQKRDDRERALIAVLKLSAVYLRSDNPEQARDDLEHALRVAQAQEPRDHEIIWQCFMELAVIAEKQGETTYALHAAERALRLVDEHLSERADLRERPLSVINRIRGDMK